MKCIDMVQRIALVLGTAATNGKRYIIITDSEV